MRKYAILLKSVLILFCVLSITSCQKKESDVVPEEETVVPGEETKPTEPEVPVEPEIVPEKEKEYTVVSDDPGYDIYNPGDYNGYNYGPSIIINEDGSMDAWFASPGNNGSQWDWIRYRHSDDGINWSASEVVLTPTSGSLDSCSACDPGVIYFGGYYYLAYTSTSDAGRNGYNNSAFVARSQYPDGPFEKWNGSGWGGYPEPFIQYTNNPDGWGIGEVSFVIYDEKLYIYSTYRSLDNSYKELRIADLTEYWPNTMVYKGTSCYKAAQDSIDVVYIDELDTFYAFAINNRMEQNSQLMVLESKDGSDFDTIAYAKTNIRDYAHNLGVGKSKEGHIANAEDILIGYAYGKQWARWSTVLQRISVVEDQ